MDVSFTNAIGIPDRAIVSVRVGEQRRQLSYKDNCSLRFDPSQSPLSTKKRIVVDVFERVGTKKIWLSDLAGEGHELSDRIVVPRTFGDSKPPVHLDMKVVVHGPETEQGKRPSSAATRHESTIKAGNYLEQNSVQTILTTMMQVVLLQQPEDPVTFMSKYLADYAKASSRPGSAPAARSNSNPLPQLPKPEATQDAKQAWPQEGVTFAKKVEPNDQRSLGSKSVASLATITEQICEPKPEDKESLREDLRQSISEALTEDHLLTLLRHAVEGKELSQSCQAWIDQRKRKRTKQEMIADFNPIDGDITEADWCGELIDLFSPDDANPDSRRFIDVFDGKLCISADTGGEKWGKKFSPEGKVNPTLLATEKPNMRSTNFESKIPDDAPETVKKEVAAGALSFTLVMGTSLGKKVLKFPGLYDGKGGYFTPAGGDVLACDCDNFWEYV